MKRNCLLPALLSVMALTACTDDDNLDFHLPEAEYGTPNEWYYSGGKLGTTSIQSAYAYRQATSAVDEAGLSLNFQIGESLFEKDYNTSNGAFAGLGPVYVRRGCLYCHPNYGHGKRQTNTYRADQDGNGYLLVVYDKQTDAYIYSVAGMPQTKAVKPFKPQIDESKITIDWKNYTDEWGNKFPDGETYSLIYPEVTIPADAYYSPVTVKRNGQYVVIPDDQVASEIGVRLESTIGIYGTGITDAIPDDSITAEWKRQSDYFNSVGKTDALNPAYWNQSTGSWISYYVNNAGDKKQYVRRYTYAMSRGPILDAAGANAIWNITNVTRPDRPKLYTTTAWADAMAADKEVIEKIKKDPTSPFWADTDDAISDKVKNLLSPGTNQFDNQWHNFSPEMSADKFYEFMVWHRGLAIPRARNLNDARVQRGKELFTQMGCAACHRPSWTTGDDNYWTPNMIADKKLPRYKHQTIYPYSDMMQHKLYMINDIHGSWCRTTPLWGRGLAEVNGSGVERLHDCRARNEVEAIMWHAYDKRSHAYSSAEKFYNLPKADRDAVVMFLRSI